ncbi:MAG: flippase-like domain-containing protein [Crocinitomicaceae bacterium]|nr:MAG: flippase-like domain-containing protein [Crocinitomicaceae bacterium]
MESPSIIERSFQGWKMWLGIIIGVLVAVWMLYSSVSATRFIEAEKGKGLYRWEDKNHNQYVDLADTNEFIYDTNGMYRKQTVSDALRLIHWTPTSFLWILVALICVVGRDFFYMLRIRLLTHNELTWKASFYVIMLWEFASALSPGVVGGVAVAMFILNKEKIDLGRSTAIVLITAMMDNLFYVLMIPFVFLFIDSATLFPHHSFGSSSVQFIFWTGFFVFLGLTLFLFTSLFILPSFAKRILVFVFSLPLLNRKKEKVTAIGENIEKTALLMREEPFYFWIKVFLATCGSWISRYLVINALLQAFLQLGILDHILLLGKQLVLWLLMRVSPTPGGSGIAEYAFGELLVDFSQSALLLASLAIVWRLMSYFPYLFIGAILLPRWLKRRS